MAKSAKTVAPPAAARPSLKMVDFQPGNVKEVIKTVASGGNKTVYMVPIGALNIMPGFNLRVTDSPEYKARLDTLKRLILADGFYTTKPLAGFVGKNAKGEDVIFITDGHRRFEAAKAAIAEGAEIEKLPVILKPASTSSGELTVSLINENDGEPLTMLEKAIAVKRLLASGMDEKEVAAKLDFSTRYISDLLVLVGAPKGVRSLVSAGKVSGTEAVKQLRKAPDPKAAEEKLTELTAKAGARGKGRVTAADSSPVADSAAEAGVKMKTTVTRYAMARGQRAPFVEIEPFKGLFPDTDWYALTDREGIIEAAEDFEIIIKVRRPEPVEAEPEPVEPKKRGRKPRATAAAEPPGELVYDPDLDESGESADLDAPNLRDLGVADAADTAADL